MKYTIKDLANGKVALENNGTFDELVQVLKEAFPIAYPPEEIREYYFADKTNHDFYISDGTLPTAVQSVKDFLTTK